MENRKQLGVAVVGAGEYTLTQIIPSLRETTHCRLAALVGGDRQEMMDATELHGLSSQHIYSYEQFEAIREDSDVDIVYVTLPNYLHAEYSIRAAQAGKHVICEKPMGMNPQECRYMIQVAEEMGVRLSMGYRLHFDPFHRELMRLGQQQELGAVTKIRIHNSMELDENEWRLDPEKSGGGALVNNGIYAIQAAIYILGQLPNAVTARYTKETQPEKFAEIEQGIAWTLFFDDGVLVECESTYDRQEDFIEATTTGGWFRLEPAFNYDGQKGLTSVGPMQCEPVNQQREQLDDFAQCILAGKKSRVPGEMGLRDAVIIDAIYDAAKRGNCVRLSLQEFAHTIDKV